MASLLCGIERLVSKDPVLTQLNDAVTTKYQNPRLIIQENRMEGGETSFILYLQTKQEGSDLASRSESIKNQEERSFDFKESLKSAYLRMQTDPADNEAIELTKITLNRPHSQADFGWFFKERDVLDGLTKSVKSNLEEFIAQIETSVVKRF